MSAATESYARRMGIEEMFRDFKSGGYQDWPKKRCKEAAITTAQALESIEETQETRSLWLERGELEMMGNELRPTPRFEAWASDCGEENGVDLEEWTASDWQYFADAPGRFLNQIKARLERRYQDSTVESKPETVINEGHSQTAPSPDLPDELQPPLNLEALAENPQAAKGKLRWIYDQLGQNKPPSGVARSLLGVGYSEEATAAIVGQSPEIQSSPHQKDRVAATKAAVNEAVQNYNAQKAQELRVASVAPICAALLDEVGQERFEGLRHIIERQGDRLRLYDHDQHLLMEAQSGDNEQWRDTGKSRLSENKALYFQQQVAPQLDSTPSRSLTRQQDELER
ncbi:MAG: hypothetical protein SAJ12_14170 [Jaaginema sp. PMC 1079.18]|nr:hypothetical protein [Jaaginema sp. PMC 1080.18]MEC4852129.1 hypothetical protein [Jaaginema sp. PMC 1079.18]MEC4867653.1 hypothetical protein [Jaaginema sp. PMC 1078.18]